MRKFFFFLLLGFDVCIASEWKSEVKLKLDGLAEQLNDGCSSEVQDARTLYKFKNGESYLYATLISVEGQHCGNNSIEYLAVYDVGYECMRSDVGESPAHLRLAGFAIVGGRGKRFVDFKSLKFSNGIFSVSAKVYKNDAMCCPSLPMILKYKLSS